MTLLANGLTQADEDVYYRALLLSSQDSIPSSFQGRPEEETKQARNNLMAPIQPQGASYIVNLLKS